MSSSNVHWNAQAYDEVSDPQVRWGSVVLDRLQLAGDETVLDAGCGSGRLTEPLTARLPTGHVIGLDASFAMAAMARERLGSRAPIVVANLNHPLPFARASFNAVFSTATFHWVRDQATLYRSCAAVLRPGGQLVAQCGGAGNIASVRAAIRSLGAADLDPWVFATPDEVRRMLLDNGFDQVETWLHPEPTSFESVDDLAGFLSTCVLNPWLDQLPESERRAFALAVAAQLPDRTIDYVRLNVTALRGATQ